MWFGDNSRYSVAMTILVKFYPHLTQYLIIKTDLVHGRSVDGCDNVVVGGAMT